MKGLKLHALKGGASRQGRYVHIVPLDPGLKTGDCGARSVHGVEGSAIQGDAQNPRIRRTDRGCRKNCRAATFLG